MRTYQVEIIVVATALAAVLVFANGPLRTVDVIAALAVLASFMHGQVADRLAESEEAKPSPERTSCYRMALVYFVAKEALWVTFFVATKSWSPLVGCALFLAYPVWRKLYRRVRPKT